MLKGAVILLVEDDLGDQKIIKSSMFKEKIVNELKVVGNGEEALTYLQRSKQGCPEAPLPDLILLDLNMPGMGGMELLKHIKDDEQLRIIPIVILTTSDSEQDIHDSYKLYASGYIKKPVTLRGFQKIMQDLEEYWFVVCKPFSGRQFDWVKER
jgi:CheY-like chemotaxis protein